MLAPPEARKRETGDRRRIPLNMRISPTMRAEIARRAEVNARSLTAESEILLEQALRAGNAMGAPWLRAMDTLYAFLHSAHVWRMAKPDLTAPFDDPEIYGVAMIHAIELLAAAAPPGTDFRVALSAALARIGDKK